jgi:hypothetical protein
MLPVLTGNIRAGKRFYWGSAARVPDRRRKKSRLPYFALLDRATVSTERRRGFSTLFSAIR